MDLAAKGGGGPAERRRRRTGGGHLLPSHSGAWGLPSILLMVVGGSVAQQATVDCAKGVAGNLCQASRLEWPQGCSSLQRVGSV